MLMMSRKSNNRNQMVIVSLDALVPKDHLLRLIDKCISFVFIYELVTDMYCPDNGRPSIDPVQLIKIQLIQCLYGIRSMRQTIREIEVNAAYRWFLGIGISDPVPHFSTFSKNYTRRFEGSGLYEKIFSRVLNECISHGFVDYSHVFIDGTHIKAAANNHKFIKEQVEKTARFYEEALLAEIHSDREAHHKKPLKDKLTESIDSDADAAPIETTEKKISTTDPESGWFHKGEHKEVFAYSTETACDKHGWVLGYTIHKGNEHDSTTFPYIYNLIKHNNPKMVILDAGYKTPAIAKMLLDDGVKPLFPYKRPMTKDGFFKKFDYVYDEQYDCYLCPNNKILSYSTTNRDGYREYKSRPYDCEKCPYLHQCTESSNHQKVITRHVWEEYMEECEDIRCTRGMKDLYAQRKQTIERIFGTAKECHGLRYTNMTGKARMEMKVGLTFTVMNLKKLVRMMQRAGM